MAMQADGISLKSMAPRPTEGQAMATKLASPQATQLPAAMDVQRPVEASKEVAREMPLDPPTVRKMVERMNERIQQATRDIRFSVDEESDRVVVKIVDHHSGEVVRQIPSEELLKLAERLDDLRGMFFKEEV